MSVRPLTRRSFLKHLGIGTVAVLAPFGCDRMHTLAPVDDSASSTKGSATPAGGTTEKDFSAAMGIVPPMVLPMNEDLSIDYSGLHALVDWHAEQGVSAIFIASGSGEYDYLTEDEIADIAADVVAYVAGDLPVLCGATNHRAYSRMVHNSRLAGYRNGGSLTNADFSLWEDDQADNQAMAQRIAATGVDGIFLTTPQAIPFELFIDDWSPDEWVRALGGYRSDNEEEQLLSKRLHGDIDEIVVNYFTEIHDLVSCSVYGYEYPGDMSHYKLSPEAFAQLGQLPRMIAIKDTSDLETIRAKAEAANGSILIMDADEFTVFETLQGPASGSINITSNVASGLYVRMQEFINQGSFLNAVRLSKRLTAVHDLLNQDYMRSAKVALGLIGLPIKEWTRYGGSSMIDSIYIGRLQLMIDIIRFSREEFEVDTPTGILS